MFKVEIQTFGVTDPIETSLCDALITLRIQLSECFVPAELRLAPGHDFPAESCVELIGVEPTTSSLQSWRSTN